MYRREATGKSKANPELDLFKDIECNYSLYAFSRENAIRRLCMRTISHRLFEGVVMGVICFAALKLAVDTYFVKSANAYTRISKGLDYLLAVAFTVEGALKIISLGFICDKNSYLRNAWNILDFSIIIITWLDLTVSAVNIPMMQVLRLFTVFIPLQFVSHNSSMRILLTALLKSIGSILNTLVVILMVWLMFSIVGVNFFAGRFQHCTKDVYELSTESACVAGGGEWVTYDQNFDNAINGLMFMFTLTKQENWPTLAFQGVDSGEVGEGPVKNNKWYYAYYFMVFVLIGSMFFFNLFTGAMFLNFTKVQKAATYSFENTLITEDQLNWIEIQKMILRAQPNYNVQTLPPDNSWRRPIHSFVTSKTFEVIISLVIIANVIQMSMLYEDASDTYKHTINTSHFVFTGIYTVELALRCTAYASKFWYDAWNILDLVAVVNGWLGIAINLVYPTSTILNDTPQLLRLLRMWRIFRSLSLFRSHKRLQEIMNIVQMCLPHIFNIFSLLALILFIFAILGCYLFESGKQGNVINDFYNFNNFGSAMVLALKITTGEDGSYFMFDYARTTTSCAPGVGCGNPVAFLYFYAFEFLVTFIMFNLFVSVVLDIFDKFYFSDDNTISKYKDEYERFEENWLTIGTSHSGFMISELKLLRFFSHFNGPAGLEGMDINDKAKEIIRMDICCDSDRNIFYNDLLFCMMRRFLAKVVRRTKFIKRQETVTRKKIVRLGEKICCKDKKWFVRKANPFFSIMASRITIKLWRKYARLHQEKTRKYSEKDIGNDAGSDEVQASDRALTIQIQRTLPKIATDQTVTLKSANLNKP